MSHSRVRRAVGTALSLLILAGSLVATGDHAAAQTRDREFDAYAASPGLAQVHADVFRLYWAFFERKPDIGGARHWVTEYDRCVSLLDITWAFGNSVEFRNTYGTLSDRDYITLVYRNVLNRRPDDAGYDYWRRLLANGSLNRSEMMLYFSLGNEFRRRHPLPSDGIPYRGCNQSAPVYYVNCDAVRAAGRAPLRRDQPGYRAGLDRDRDGVACETG